MINLGYVALGLDVALGTPACWPAWPMTRRSSLMPELANRPLADCDGARRKSPEVLDHLPQA